MPASDAVVCTADDDGGYGGGGGYGGQGGYGGGGFEGGAFHVMHSELSAWHNRRGGCQEGTVAGIWSFRAQPSARAHNSPLISPLQSRLPPLAQLRLRVNPAPWR